MAGAPFFPLPRDGLDLPLPVEGVGGLAGAEQEDISFLNASSELARAGGTFSGNWADGGWLS